MWQWGMKIIKTFSFEWCCWISRKKNSSLILLTISHLILMCAIAILIPQKMWGTGRLANNKVLSFRIFRYFFGTDYSFFYLFNMNYISTIFFWIWMNKLVNQKVDTKVMLDIKQWYNKNDLLSFRLCIVVCSSRHHKNILDNISGQRPSYSSADLLSIWF